MSASICEHVFIPFRRPCGSHSLHAVLEAEGVGDWRFLNVVGGSLSYHHVVTEEALCLYSLLTFARAAKNA